EIVRPIDWIGGPGIIFIRVAQEGAKVASGGKYETAVGRILGALNQFVQMSRFESIVIAEMLFVRRRSPILLAYPKAPGRVRDRLPWILLARPHGERGQKPVREWCGIIRARRRIGVVAVDRIVLDLLTEAD